MSNTEEVTQEILDLIIDENTRSKVATGEYIVWPKETWNDELRPVVREAGTNRMVKGTGKVKGTPDPAMVSRQTAYQRRKGYRYLMEDFIPPSDLRDNPNAIISFKELVNNLIEACEGIPKAVTCNHPGCKEQHTVVLQRDPKTLYKLTENLIGRAKETQDINVTSQQLVAVLNERTPIEGLTVHTIDPSEEQRRREALRDLDNTEQRRLGTVADGGSQ